MTVKTKSRKTRTRTTSSGSSKRPRSTETESADLPRRGRAKRSAKPEATKVSESLITRNLAAEYRPKSLDDFIGQEQVTQVVKGWIKSKQFPSSMLVMGETGAGKTTFAKLVARYVNCRTMNACGKCDYCSYKNDLPDVIHINCGEKGKVEDIRELLAGSNMAPKYRKRIYILDEVHMASAQAREAMLVPLETPPAGTIFILCTTEEDKIKATMSNRCQTLVMRPVEPEIIADRLADIVGDLGIKVKQKDLDDVLLTIADFSQGQVRKAISDLDVFLSSVASGMVEFSSKDFIEVYEKQGGADLDKLAASMLVYILNEDLPKFVQICAKVDKNAKAVISKFIWLTQWLIQFESGAIKYTPYIGTIWNKAKQKGKVGKYSLALLLHIAYIANEIDRNILQTPGLSANSFMMTNFADMIIGNVFDDLRKGK